MRHKLLLGLTGSVASVLYEKLIKKFEEFANVDVVVTPRSQHFYDNKSIRKILKDTKGKLYNEEDEWTFPMKRSTDHNSFSRVDLWGKDDSVLHIELRDKKSALIIAPCSANTMAKLANGICDNLLTSVARAWDINRPVIIAPAMNTYMWEHSHTKRQLDVLKDLGYIIVPPQAKMLACGTWGIGALANIEDIIDATMTALRWQFPLEFEACSGVPVDKHPGAFATQRKHECHTGVDLYTHEGALVYAVENGRVVGAEHFTGAWDKSPWWENTDCLLIEGATGVVCYGEIEYSSDMKVGKMIKRGQYIARVKRVLKEGKERKDIPGHSTSMLHMELYPHGTTKPSNGFEKNLLRNPTPYLMGCTDCYKIKSLTYENS